MTSTTLSPPDRDAAGLDVAPPVRNGLVEIGIPVCTAADSLCSHCHTFTRGVQSNAYAQYTCACRTQSVQYDTSIVAL